MSHLSVSLRRLVLGLALLTTPAVALADPRDDARRHFAAGLDAAADGDYRGAVERFLAAYGSLPHPATAFNIARSYEDLGELEDALFWYRRFQEMAPERASEAVEPIRRVEGALAARAPAPVPPAEVDTQLQQLQAERDALLERLREAGLEHAPQAAAPAPPDAPTGEAAPGEPAAAEPVPTTAPREALLTDAYEQVIVTASRYGQAPLDSPSSVAVITGEDIRMSGAIHLADALRRVVGIDVMSMAAGTPYVGVRAFNGEMPNKVLWLVDGRPASLEFLATPLPFTLGIGLDEIERVEVIRGPGAAIYGANAVTGVVNVITRRPGEGPAVQASVSGGLNRFVAGSAVASGGKGAISYRIGAGYQQEGRFSKAAEELPDSVVPFKRDQDLGDRRVRADARFDARFADQGWASLSGAWSNGFTEYFSKAALGNFGLEGTAGNIRADVGYGPWHLRAYWMREEGRTAPWLASAGSVRNTEAYVRDDVADVETEFIWKAHTGPVEHRFHIGGGYRYKEYRAGVFEVGFQVPRREHHFAIFGQYQLEWDWLQVVGSLRWDRHPLLDLDATVSPRGALLFRLAKHTSLRASAGTAFRAMNGLESYVNLELNTAADGYFVRFYGAAIDPRGQTLTAERVTNAELGLRDESSRWHTLDATVWWNRVTDLIDIGSVEPVLGAFEPDPNGFPFGEARWVNTATVYDAVGGELDLSFFPVDGLDVYANLSLARVFGTEDDERFIDRSTALVHANAGVLYRSPWRVDLTVSGHYVSKQVWRVPSFDDVGNVVISEEDLPGRFLLVSRVAVRPLVDPTLELAVTLWNPLGFGAGFREHPNGQIVGPRLYGTATVAF